MDIKSIQGMQKQLQAALKKAEDAEAQLIALRSEDDTNSSLVQQLLTNAGNLTAQMDSLQARSDIEVGAAYLK